MQGIYSAVRLALSLSANSLLETIPQNIDNCLWGYRIIVIFAGKEDSVELILAEILDSEWELVNNSVTKDFEQQVQKIVDTRNIEFRYSIKQQNEIMDDRRW